MDFNKTSYELHTNGGYTNAAVFNFLQWQTPKLVRWEHHFWVLKWCVIIGLGKIRSFSWGNVFIQCTETRCRNYFSF